MTPRKRFVLLAIAIASPAASAGDPAPSGDLRLPDVTVFGDVSKKSTYDYVPTVTEISGRKLDRKKKSTIGETLSKETGVASSFFGPNASRPIIRGLDGERIRILNNGVGVLDASAASQDHGVAVEPMAVDRVEIVRGPSALLYGSSAVGGVVNVVTNRILERVPDGLEGKIDAHSTSNDRGKTGAIGLNYGTGDWAFHLDASGRNSSDYRIPDYARTGSLRSSTPLEDDSVEGYHSVPNSDNQTYSGAIGTSYVTDRGFAGLSWSHYRSNYGTVAEQDVKIKMRQDRYDLSLGAKDLGFIRSLRLKNAYSDYEHTEFEAGAPGTKFTNVGDESRIELKHRDLGNWSGLFGVQNNFFKFAAVGEESFLPETRNEDLAAFVFEEGKYGSWKPSLGARIGRTSVKSDETYVDADPANPGESTTGGPGASRSFTPLSASVGGAYSLSSASSLVLNLAYTERAPDYQELFANGPHLATGAFERGDLSLGKEESRSAEFSYRYERSGIRGMAGVFLQDFRDYISLSPQTGGGFDPDGAPGNRDLVLYQYSPVEARFYGAEFEISRTFEGVLPGGALEIGLRGDSVRAKDRSTGENLPRITPIRETLEAAYHGESFDADAEVQHVEKQTRVAPNETPTEGYTLVSLGGDVPFTLERTACQVYARLENAFDVEARNHVSFLKDIAPLPGRNFVLGVQAAF